MNIDDIRSKLLELNEKMKSINNECNDINVGTIVFCWCEFGELMNRLRMFYHENGFPVEGCDVILSRLWTLDCFSSSCRLTLCDLEKNRFILKDDFLDKNVFGNLFYEICSSCCSGNYDEPINSTVSNLKKIVLCELMNISYNYWSSQLKGENYYINREHLNKIQEYYQIYKNYAGVQYKNYKSNENGSLVCVYEGPQFGNEIEELLCFLNKNYDKVNASKKLEKIKS